MRQTYRLNDPILEIELGQSGLIQVFFAFNSDIVIRCNHVTICTSSGECIHLKFSNGTTIELSESEIYIGKIDESWINIKNNLFV